MGVPNGWQYDGTTLVAPNGVSVVGTFLQAVLSHDPQWPAGLSPLAPATVDANGDEHQLFGLELNFVVSNQSLTETPGSVPPALSPSAQSVLNATNALSGTLTLLGQVTTDLGQNLTTLKASAGV